MNAQSKHTEGPWDWDKGTEPHFQSQVYGENNGRTIAVCYNDESNANAKLISAAPSLLEALQMLVKEIDLSKLNIRKNFSLINAHAYALKQIHKATQD